MSKRRIKFNYDLIKRDKEEFANKIYEYLTSDQHKEFKEYLNKKESINGKRNTKNTNGDKQTE